MQKTKNQEIEDAVRGREEAEIMNSELKKQVEEFKYKLQALEG